MSPSNAPEWKRLTLRGLAACIAGVVLLPAVSWGGGPEGAAPAAPVSELAPVATEATGELRAQAQAAVERAGQYLKGQSLTVGGGYTVDKFRVFKLRGIPSEGLGIAMVDMTDNGGLAPFVEYASAERPIASAPLALGALTLGYNLIASYSTFDVNRELVDNPFHGENFGTRVQGDFALAGAQVFARLGPLYPGSEVFWNAALGAGGALLRYSGTVQVRQGIHYGEFHSVSGQPDTLRIFTSLNWDLQFGRWLVSFRTLAIGTGTSDEQVGLERNSVYLAYNFRF